MTTISDIRKQKQISFEDFDNDGDMFIDVIEDIDTICQFYIDKKEAIKLRDYLIEQLTK